MPSKLEEEFALQLRAARLPAPEREHVFAPPRRFRFDFAWPERKIAVEIDGGTWIGGRHNRGSGLERDYEKMNLAVAHGWSVLRFSSTMLRSGEAIAVTEQVLQGRAA